MKSEIKQKWIDALRSGKYKQGEGFLRGDNNNFCCLGVLTNIYAQEHPYSAKQQKNPNSYLGSKAYLPKAVAKWAGFTKDEIYELHEDDKSVNILIGNNSASDLNDYMRYSFKQIAKEIEKHL